MTQKLYLDQTKTPRSGAVNTNSEADGRPSISRSAALLKHTIPLSSAIKPKRITAFWSKVDRSGGANACWPWLGLTNQFGYGRFSIKRRDVYAHRVAFTLTKGEIPDGLFICHACDNPACCNPAHLWLGTQAENIRDCWDKGRGSNGGPENCRRGEAHGRAKVNEDQVREIRRLHASGDAGYRRLAQAYGLTPMAIKAIVRRKSWAHVMDEAS